MQYSELGKFLFETGLRGALEQSVAGKGGVLFIDYCRVADKYPFLNELAMGLAPRPLYVLDGRVQPHPDKDMGLANFIHPPANVYYRANWKRSPRDPQETQSNFPRLSQLAENFARLNANYFDYVDSNIIEDCVETAYFFSICSMRLLRPDLVMIWNAFHPLSQAAARAARDAQIPVLYVEYGLLPGTINVDAMGQMGQSAVLQQAAAFNDIPVSDEELLDAADMLDFLRETGMNRRQQHEPGDLPHRIATAASGRKTVLFAGHNDFSSGVMPWDETAKEFHAPFFERASDAAEFMLSLAQANDWLLISKAHPFNTRSTALSDGDNCICIGDENINACIDAADVTATVLSQVNYQSLIRETPVVMLGNNQLNGSGAVHAPATLDQIEPALQAALRDGFTTECRAQWLAHAARLAKAYLYRYSDDQPPEITAADVGTLARRITTMIDTNTFADPFLTEKHEIKQGVARARRRSSGRIVEIH